MGKLIYKINRGCLHILNCSNLNGTWTKCFKQWYPKTGKSREYNVDTEVIIFMTYEGTMMCMYLYHQKMSYVKDLEQKIDSKRCHVYPNDFFNIVWGQPKDS